MATCASKLTFGAITLLLSAAALTMAARVTANQEAGVPLPQTQCTFSDGATMDFGHSASALGGGADIWQAGNYEAIPFAVSKRMQFAPLDGGVQVPAGSYTLFVDTSKSVPWTLIISKKSGVWGIPYPGEQYDVARVARMGSDLLRSPVEHFVIGCTPANAWMMWMASGTHVTYAKVWPWAPGRQSN